jgi:hypothetical protein
MDWVKIISIVAVAIVTIVAFGLGVDAQIQSNLVLGLLSVVGVYGIGAGVRYMLERMK